MEKLKRNDKVKIINASNIWKNKNAIVISQSDDEMFDENGLDVTDVKVKITFGDEENPKTVIQEFPRHCLELETKNESLNELYEAEKLNLASEEDFKNYFIDKRCRFNGFDYSKLFKPVKQKDNSLSYSEEDLEYINYYKDLEKIPCRIVACALIDSFDLFETPKENFISAYWNIEFDNGDMLPAISGVNLTLLDVKFEALCENKNKDSIEDYIKDYVYTETLDDILPSWFFVDKIAAAENLKAENVVKDAKLLGYKIYKISAPHFDKLALAASKCLPETILDDYGDYLQGNVEVKEI